MDRDRKLYHMIYPGKTPERMVPARVIRHIEYGEIHIDTVLLFHNKWVSEITDHLRRKILYTTKKYDNPEDAFEDASYRLEVILGILREQDSPNFTP